MDNHHITLRFFPFAFPNDFIALGFFSDPVLYMYGSKTIKSESEKTDPAKDLANFEENPIWAHTMNDLSTYIYKNNQDMKIDNKMVSRVYDVGIVEIKISRNSDGVLLRLGFPVVVLLILVGLTFWSAYETRITDTMSILLSVSALYIVIFGNIPLVGYLTSFDRYMLSMFIFVGCCIALHQVTRRMYEKNDSWPLRRVYVRVLEFFGRLFILPIVVFTYYLTFRDNLDRYSNLVVTLIITVTIACISQGMYY